MSAPSTETRDATFIGTQVTILTITTAVVVLRFYTRRYIVRRIWLDDWTILVALVLSIVMGCLSLVDIKYGAGHHIWTIDPRDLTNYFKVFYFTVLLYQTCQLVIKTSFMLQYYRIFPLEAVQRVCIILGAVVLCWSLSQVFLVIFGCEPIPSFWDKTIDGKCLSPVPTWYINAGGNLLTDLAILILPLPILHGLRLPIMDKISLLFIFSLGFLTCGISILRIKFLFPGEDFTWWNVDAALWHNAELCCGIICSCLPTLRSFVTRFIPSLASEYSRKADRERNRGGASTTVGMDNSSRSTKQECTKQEC